MSKVSVFDIDGTLFPYGHDFFFHTMGVLLQGDEIARFFKDGKTVAAAERALQYCQSQLIARYGEDYQNRMTEECYRFCKGLIAEGEYYPQGFYEIQAAVAIGHDVYLSTANIEPIVIGVVKAMKDNSLLPESVKLLCSTWRDGQIFANIAENKIVSLEKATGEVVFDLDATFYCDDISGNDRGLAELCAWTYVIDGKHNRKDALRGNMMRLTWKKLVQNHKN